jgi:hypothetical protein
MKKQEIHIHTWHDGRGVRDIFVSGKLVRRVLYADEKKGIVRVVHAVIRLDKNRENVLTRTRRGKVVVVFRDP